MKPIATYNEQRFDGKRQFELFEDKIIVRGNATFKSEFEIVIPLSMIDPQFSRIRLRHNMFFSGIWMTVVSWILAYIFDAINQNSYSKTLDLLWFMGFMGVFIMLVMARKVEWVRFVTNAGVVVLDIARAGKYKGNFDTFVELLNKQIKDVNTNDIK